MKENVRFLCDVDVSGLRERLEKNPDLFGQFDWRKEAYAHRGMTDIWVRYNHPDRMGPAFNAEHSSIWYPAVRDLPEVPAICLALMARVRGERLGGVLITKLPPGGRIKRHVDQGWHAAYYSKFYVAVKNEPGAEFHWEDRCIDPAPGEVYEFRNDVPHWVENNSDEDRIAMIVCIRTLRQSLEETAEP